MHSKYQAYTIVGIPWRGGCGFILMGFFHFHFVLEGASFFGLVSCGGDS